MAATASNAASLVSVKIERERVCWVFDQIDQKHKESFKHLNHKDLQNIFNEAIKLDNPPEYLRSYGMFMGIGERFHEMDDQIALILLKWSIRRIGASELMALLEHTKPSFLKKILKSDRLANPKQLEKQLNIIEKKVNEVFNRTPLTDDERTIRLSALREYRLEVVKLKNEIAGLQATLSLQGDISPVQLKKRIGSTTMTLIAWSIRSKSYLNRYTRKDINVYGLTKKEVDQKLPDKELDKWKNSYRPILLRIEDEKDGLLKKIQAEMTKLTRDLDGPAPAVEEELDDADREIETTELLSILLRPPIPLPGQPAIPAERYVQEKLKLQASDWQGIAKEVIKKGITLETLRSNKTEAAFLQAINGA